MYSLIQKGRRLNLPTDIMLKLFDSCVEPILLYGCEVWGYENVDILGKVHIIFCKKNVNNKSKTENGTLLDENIMYTILYNLHCKNVHNCHHGLHMLVTFFKTVAVIMYG